MTTYEESGVNIVAGDVCSKLAYEAAKTTFAGRAGMMGAAVVLEGGFSGALDMGDYYLVQNDDGVGSKMMIADALRKFDTVGQDLVAMVADDAICVGAEVISLTNTVDIEKVDADVIGPMMKGLEKVCLEQKIVVPGGEIAELPGQVKGVIWNATAVGMVKKKNFIDGSKVKSGDAVLGIRSAGFRSNGFSLVRKILLDKFGEDWVNEDYGDGRSWGEVVLEPSLVYHRALLELMATVDVHALVHVTGGGFDGNLWRVIDKEKFKLDGFDGEEPLKKFTHEPMLKLMELGNVAYKEAAKTWNMGIGMILIVDVEDIHAVINGLSDFKLVKIGKVH